jgi:hypothetical protein
VAHETTRVGASIVAGRGESQEFVLGHADARKVGLYLGAAVCPSIHIDINDFVNMVHLFLFRQIPLIGFTLN